MPQVRPFPGIRYTSSDLADLICPPYDVISKDEQDFLYERSPHNAVRLELARADGDGPNRYSNVAETFTEWLDGDVMKADDAPSMYVYRQDFTAPDGTRRRVAGVIGALKLEPFGDGILPHERTMPGPKADRLALMRALPVNISSLYAIYRGGGGLSPFIDALENRPPDARVAQADVLHRLWVIDAPAEVEMFVDALAPGPLVIADGHHRYETALAFHAAQPTPGPHDSVMCFCVDADAEGLVVLPYHRILTGADPRSLEAKLRERWGADDVGEDPTEWLEGSEATHAFCFLLGDTVLGIEMEEGDVDAALGDRATAWKALAVVVLHEVLLPEVLDLADVEFRFTRAKDEAERAVEGEAAVGILMRAVEATEVVDVAASGERMPQKASYFWPKVITGLVFRSLK